MRTLIMCLSLLLQQCSACIFRLTRMVLEMGSMWLYSCCFVRGCFQVFINLARSILAIYHMEDWSIRLNITGLLPSSGCVNTTLQRLRKRNEKKLYGNTTRMLWVYIYIYMCVCVCVCVHELENIQSFKGELNISLKFAAPSEYAIASIHK